MEPRRGTCLSRLRGAVPAPGSGRARGDKQGRPLTDLRGTLHLDIGYPVFNPEANNREYRGRIDLTIWTVEEPEFVGITDWGPSGRVDQHSKVVYSGPDLDKAIKAVNDKIEAKLDKGYRPVHSDNDPFLYPETSRGTLAGLTEKT
jgi:hypothetical protein